MRERYLILVLIHCLSSHSFFSFFFQFVFALYYFYYDYTMFFQVCHVKIKHSVHFERSKSHECLVFCLFFPIAFKIEWEKEDHILNLNLCLSSLFFFFSFLLSTFDFALYNFTSSKFCPPLSKQSKSIVLEAYCMKQFIICTVLEDGTHVAVMHDVFPSFFANSIASNFLILFFFSFFA